MKVHGRVSIFGEWCDFLQDGCAYYVPYPGFIDYEKHIGNGRYESTIPERKGLASSAAYFQGMLNPALSKEERIMLGIRNENVGGIGDHIAVVENKPCIVKFAKNYKYTVESFNVYYNYAVLIFNDEYGETVNDISKHILNLPERQKQMYIDYCNSLLLQDNYNLSEIRIKFRTFLEIKCNELEKRMNIFNQYTHGWKTTGAGGNRSAVVIDVKDSIGLYKQCIKENVQLVKI